jgi:hypothetical protein
VLDSRWSSEASLPNPNKTIECFNLWRFSNEWYWFLQCAVYKHHFTSVASEKSASRLTLAKNSLL